MVHYESRRLKRQECGILLGLMMLVLAGSIGVLPAAAEPAGDSHYRLSAGDKVRITVFGHEDLSGEFELDGTGRFSMPLIQFVNAAGLTVEQLEAAVIAKLKPSYLKNPHVSAEVVAYKPFYILGEVKQPGSYPYSAGMTLVNAVALAGGYTYRASKRRLYVVRADDAEKKRERAAEETLIMPGDVIEVPERHF